MVQGLGFWSMVLLLLGRLERAFHRKYRGLKITHTTVVWGFLIITASGRRVQALGFRVRQGPKGGLGV